MHALPGSVSPLANPPWADRGAHDGPCATVRPIEMKRLILVFGIAVVAVAALYSGWQLNRWREAEEERRLRQIHTLTGTVKRYPGFRSEALGLERRVWVYLPPMYDEEPERRFPVLYMHDGQNVFDGATAFLAGKEWEADEAAERLIEEASHNEVAWAKRMPAILEFLFPPRPAAHDEVDG